MNPTVVRTNNKIKIELEYMVKSSPRILYNFLSTPSGLSEWFADDVNIQNGIYSFFWEDSEEKARLLVAREFDLVRFKWLSTDNDDTYFEMRIKIDELTGDVALIITDFAPKDELQEVQMLWDAQIHDLQKALGS
ncbi:MAG: START-like domain-containing protein [Flavobacteriales bacterium]|nr:START-like domain-containing protein [Flavobacteriales bacterium]